MNQEIEPHKKTYEQLQETLVELANENYVLSKALDEACDLLEKSEAGTTCDEENRKIAWKIIVSIPVYMREK